MWALAGVGLFVAFLLLLIWSSRRTLVRRVTPVALERIERLLPNLSALTGGPVTEGNRVEVIQDAAFFDALLEDLRRAERTIHYETYIWWRGAICRELAEAFAERARAGVEVRLLLDAHGARTMEAGVRRTMEETGCQVAWFHPFAVAHLGKVNSRDHRKIAVVDGRIAYFMGHGVAEEWAGGRPGERAWRDTAVRIQGPAVASAQTIFLKNWLKVNDELVIDARNFPALDRQGDARIHVAASDPVGTYSEVEILLEVAIASAQERLIIQNPYFVPAEPVLELLAAAVDRGVDVRLMLPRENDSLLVRHASHRSYLHLLRAGVRLWEYLPTFAHQKVVVVDDVWSHVGSTNFDHRSLQINREVSVGILDRGVAAELTAAFEEDLKSCEEVTLEGWASRSPLRGLGDRLAYLMREQI
ncbi:MAG: phospholipase D-like domain-containing protein [Thermoanaerobaculia bacterium]